MIEIYQKIWLILTSKERKKTAFLLVLMVSVGFLEVIGIGSVMPFLAVLGRPELVQTNIYLSSLYVFFSFTNIKSFLIFLGIFALMILLVSAGLKILTFYTLCRFSNTRRDTLGYKLLSNYLNQPYSFFLQRNSSETSKIILSEVDSLIEYVLMPTFQLITYSIISIFICIFLVIMDPFLALILSLIFGSFYAILYFTVTRYITHIGEERVKANSKRFKVTSETINGIKDIKVFGMEQTYLYEFSKPSEKYSRYTATTQILTTTPQFLVEAIAFSAILTMAIFALSSEDSSIGKLLPMLGLYAMGALKLKPAVNSVYSSLSAIQFGIPALNTVLSDLQIASKEYIDNKNNCKKLLLKKELEFRGINFSYQNMNVPSLKNINIIIKANTAVGIIGTTGAGKSTLVDLLLGLLPPTDGEILVDGNPLTIANIRQWQNSIGYVPQSIFLTDDSIVNNIAFGIAKNEIDMDQVVSVAKMAQIHDLIITLNNGYYTGIGERGVRLSGGQRQRLGIARALYRNPTILILDEATSALDNKTEEEVMEAIYNISGNKTIIMIAHRLSTIEKCNQLIHLEKGKVKENR